MQARGHHDYGGGQGGVHEELRQQHDGHGAADGGVAPDLAVPLLDGLDHAGRP